MTGTASLPCPVLQRREKHFFLKRHTVLSSRLGTSAQYFFSAALLPFLVAYLLMLAFFHRLRNSSCTELLACVVNASLLPAYLENGKLCDDGWKTLYRVIAVSCRDMSVHTWPELIFVSINFAIHPIIT